MKPGTPAGQAAPFPNAASIARVQPPARLAPMPTLCSNCGVRNVCLPWGLPQDEVPLTHALVSNRKRIRAGEHVFRAGDRFDSLYAFRVGFFMTYVVTRDGRTHVTGFPMAGDLAGMDGVGTGAHTHSAVALEDGEVCIVGYAHLNEMIGDVPMLRHQVNRIMSREIVRTQNVMTMLASGQAEAKVAGFLMSLSQRLAARGYSPTEFVLRMTRADIGDYLGLQLETVSRILSSMQKHGIIRVQQRHVVIVDRDALYEMTLERPAPASAPRVAEPVDERTAACILPIEEARRSGRPRAAGNGRSPVLQPPESRVAPTLQVGHAPSPLVNMELA